MDNLLYWFATRSVASKAAIPLVSLALLASCCCCGVFFLEGYGDAGGTAAAGATPTVQPGMERGDESVPSATPLLQAATASPVPTETPRATLSPAPSPTETATALPSATPPPATSAPTSAPNSAATGLSTEGATPTPVPAGLGVPRVDIRRVFYGPDIGFVFEKAQPVNGQARFIGTAPNGLAVLELIGPRDDLVKVYMLAGVPSDNEAAATESAIYLAGVLSLAVPGWEAGTEWLTDSISALPEERLITTEHGAAVISLEWFEELGFIGLEIRARGWE